MDGPRSVVVVGASAGGVEALSELVAELPEDLAAAVCVVLHLAPSSRSRLPAILERAGSLPAREAWDGDELREGHVFVAPPDRHLLVEDGRCRVTRGPHENHLRPSVDVLFRSAAVAYGPRAIGVVLSGARDDGVVGANAISRRGGCVLVQDPDDALFPGMPTEALVRDHPDGVHHLPELAHAVARAAEGLSKEAPMRDNDGDEMNLEIEYSALDPHALGRREGPPGESSQFSCPACGGVLWEVADDEQLRFRCRVGHAYTADGTLDGQEEVFESALWTAIRALQERAQLTERMAERMGAHGSEHSRRRFEDLAREAREQADVVRRVLAGRDGPGD